MVRTEVQTNTYVHNWITSQRTRLQLLTDTLINTRDEFTRNHTAFDVVSKGITSAFFQWEHVDHNVTILTTTTRLFSVLTLNIFDFRANSFTVSYLWFTHISFNLELTTHTVNDDFQVQLTHTSDDGLA
eukprot:RCo011493